MRIELGHEGWAWVQAAGMLAGSLAAGLAVKSVAIRVLERWFQNTATRLDDLLLAALRAHLPFWFVLLGADLAIRIAPLPAGAAAVGDRVALALFVISLSMACAKFTTQWILHYGNRHSLGVSTLSLTQNLIRVVIVGTGLLVVLSNLGISIAPLLTALGVGSLAVALALQDTLSNLFAGFTIILNKPVRIGDYVQLDSGQEGYVEDIGWRTCRIRQLSGNMVEVPNTKLSQAILVNYHRPEKDLAVLVQVGVGYDSDLEHVERVTIEVGEEVMRTVAGGVPEFKPFIRYNTFGDSAILFTAILRGKEFTDRFLVTHEFIKRLQVRYRQEGISIPFPQRDVRMKS